MLLPGATSQVGLLRVPRRRAASAPREQPGTRTPSWARALRPALHSTACAC